MKRTVLALSLLWVLAGTAPASAAFLGENPHLGESFLDKGIGPAAGDVNRDRLPGSCGSCLERPAECFVAPAAEGVDLELYYKPGWTDAQRAAADAKCLSLTEGDTVVAQSQRAGTSAAARYRQAGNTIPAGNDVDHVIDLQLNGADDISNMSPLDASVNRSLGAQIQQRIKNLPLGTRVNQVNITDR